MPDAALQAAQRKADNFQRDIERGCKHYHPDLLVPALAAKLDEVRRTCYRVDLLRTWPPHHLLHAMEAACAYHRYAKPLKKSTLANLINIYHRYHEPLAKYYLRDGQGLYLFQVYIARQQLFLQHDANFHDASRSLLLFEESQYPQTVALMRERFGFGFHEWTRFCTAVWAAVENRTPSFIDQAYLRDAEGEIVPHEKIPALFDLLSSTIEQVGTSYQQLRAEPGKVLYDPALPSSFLQRPLLRLSNGRYIVTHKPLVFYRGFEGPYDIAQEAKFRPFSQEFGAAFQSYVGRVLSHLPNIGLYTEADIQHHLGADHQACDFCVVGDNFVWLIECKAVKYSAVLSSKNAVKGDTSTTRIVEAIDQLTATANAVRDSRLDTLVGDGAGKILLATVVTFRPIHAANNAEYWREVFEPKLSAPGAADWKARFSFRPQVMAVVGLEQLVLLAHRDRRSPLSLFEEKLAKNYLIEGDWEIYLGKRLTGTESFPIWQGAFDQFFDDIIERVSGEV